MIYEISYDDVNLNNFFLRIKPYVFPTRRLPELSRCLLNMCMCWLHMNKKQVLFVLVFMCLNTENEININETISWS